LRLGSLDAAANAATGSLAHFEDHADVQGQTPASAWERHLKGFDALNGPTFSSAPNVKEIREAAEKAIWEADYRQRRTPIVDFMPLLVEALSKLKGHGPPRYFLYTLKRGVLLEPVLREQRLPATSLYLPGAIYEPVGEFANADEARRAFGVLAEALRKGRFDPTAITSPPP
jgi:hypothetical protein